MTKLLCYGLFFFFFWGGGGGGQRLNFFLEPRKKVKRQVKWVILREMSSRKKKIDTLRIFLVTTKKAEIFLFIRKLSKFPFENYIVINKKIQNVGEKKMIEQYSKK